MSTPADLDVARTSLSAAANDHSERPHDVARLEALCKAAVQYTRVRDALRVDRQPAVLVLPFGNSKGRRLEEAPTADLVWVLNRLLDNIKDPAKAEWRSKNEALAMSIQRVLSTRRR